MALRTRYAAPATDQRFGTSRRDPDTGNVLRGEVNQFGLPMGTRPPPGPSALTTFQASQPVRKPVLTAPAGSPDLDAMLARAKATTYGDIAPRPITLAPSAPAPAARQVPPAIPATTPTATPAAAPRLAPSALPTHPDDRALLMETRARDAAARAPEPISIPGGLTGHAMRPGEKPWAPGGDSAEGNALTAAVNRANSRFAPPQLAANPERARLDAEAARTGSVRYVPAGTPEARAVVSNTGVTRKPSAIPPRIAAPTTPAIPPAGDTGYIDQATAQARLPVSAAPASIAAPAKPVAAPPAPAFATTPGALGGPSQVPYLGETPAPDRPRPATNTMFAGVGGWTGGARPAVPPSSAPRIAPQAAPAPTVPVATGNPAPPSAPRLMPSPTAPADAGRAAWEAERATRRAIYMADPPSVERQRHLDDMELEQYGKPAAPQPPPVDTTTLPGVAQSAFRPPMLAQPRKRATPLDEPANQYA